LRFVVDFPVEVISNAPKLRKVDLTIGRRGSRKNTHIVEKLVTLISELKYLTHLSLTIGDVFSADHVNTALQAPRLTHFCFAIAFGIRVLWDYPLKLGQYSNLEELTFRYISIDRIIAFNGGVLHRLKRLELGNKAYTTSVGSLVKVAPNIKELVLSGEHNIVQLMEILKQFFQAYRLETFKIYCDYDYRCRRLILEHKSLRSITAHDMFTVEELESSVLPLVTSYNGPMSDDNKWLAAFRKTFPNVVLNEPGFVEQIGLK
jgi:hypothetical protein